MGQYGGMNTNPAFDGMVNEARAMSCADWLTHCGHMDKMKRAGGQNFAGPCPKCGGDDRFGVDAAQDKWNCRGCGIGGNDAISMVILLWPLSGDTYGERFLEACEVITGRKRTDIMSEEEIRQREEALAKKKADQADTAARKRREAMEAAMRLWKRTRPAGGHVAAYLKARGLDVDVSRLLTVHEIDDLEYWHDGHVLHKGPAMVSVILGSDGKFTGVHRTWLDPKGKKGKAVITLPGPEPEALDSKKVMGSLGDGAIRLVTPKDAAGNITATRMVVGEGQETTLTPYAFERRDDTAYWCAVSIGHMAGRAGRDPETGKRLEDEPDMEDLKCFLVPEWVKELVLLGDGDSDPRKTKAAMTRAAKRAKRLRPGITVKIAWPGSNVDWNDLAMPGEGKD